jgi:CDP-glucose 4,6-dehydratase
MTSLRSFYEGRTVLITGHTGFKGSWLALWLHELGARVVGYSLDPPSVPNNFQASDVASFVTDVRGDVRDVAHLQKAVAEAQPSVIFHLAAQSLVRRSYVDPEPTFATNVMGTVNVLDAALRVPSVRSVISVTSDKCYESSEEGKPHGEDDRLGGRDAYSASKACAEIATGVYRDRRFQRNAFLQRSEFLPISSVRAGNVFGGGDWAEDRLIPDVMRAVAGRSDVVLRSPDAVRPWQHVLEPLSGYLWLAVRMADDPAQFASAYNFGPAPNAETMSVHALVRSVLDGWKEATSRIVMDRDTSEREMALLRIDSSRARRELSWQPVWDIGDAVRMTVDWYRHYYEQGGSMLSFSTNQIQQYTEAARQNGVAWAVAN